MDTKINWLAKLGGGIKWVLLPNRLCEFKIKTLKHNFEILPNRNKLIVERLSTISITRASSLKALIHFDSKNSETLIDWCNHYYEDKFFNDYNLFFHKRCLINHDRNLKKLGDLICVFSDETFITLMDSVTPIITCNCGILWRAKNDSALTLMLASYLNSNLEDNQDIHDILVSMVIDKGEINEYKQ